MHIHKSTVLFLTAVAVAVLAGCSSTYRATRTVVHNVEHVSGSPLLVDTFNGTVRVIRDPSRSDVEITAKIVAGGRTFEKAEQRLDDSHLFIAREADDTLTVVPQFVRPERNGDGAAVTVRLPDANGVTLKTSNGPVIAQALSGELFIDTSNASVEVEDHTGSVIIDTSNGRVTAQRIRGDLEIDTSNGSVTARDVEGGVIIDTSNGSVDLVLAPYAAGPIYVDSSNGSIELTTGPGFGGTLSLETSNARLAVDVDESAAVRTFQHEGDRAFLVFDREGGESRVETSNGRLNYRHRSGG